MGGQGRRGQIIFLNGTSSSGKSSIAGQLLLMLDPPRFHMSVDAINGMRAKQKTRELDDAALAAVLTRTRAGFHRAVAYTIPGMSEPWDPAAPGILRLPSGRLVRGRGLGHPVPDGPTPSFGVYLLGRRPPAFPWKSRWIRWPDFRLPASEADVLPTLTEAWERAAAERVEVACQGGHGRTGTALACLAILDGVPGTEAVAFVREHYDRHAVETPAQRRYVTHWPGKRG